MVQLKLVPGNIFLVEKVGLNNHILAW